MENKTQKPSENKTILFKQLHLSYSWFIIIHRAPSDLKGALDLYFL